MHLEVLVEDQSGKKMLDALVPKIIDPAHTSRVHAYKGIGRIPKGLKAKSAPERRILMDQLPRLLQGYGNAFSKYPKSSETSWLDARKSLPLNSASRLKKVRHGYWEIA